MKKRMLIMLVAFVAFVAIIATIKLRQIRQGMAMMEAMQPPPAAVTTVVVERGTWQPTLNTVGSLKAVNGVTVSTDLAGIVSSIAFDSGASVQQGALLVKLDTSLEEAQLRSAEARRELTKTNLQRQQELRNTGAVAQSELDTAESEHRQAVAAVDEARALIARKQITAPFAGRLGIRQVDVGQYLPTGAPIVPLESVDPIHVEFSVPQAQLVHVAVGKRLQLDAVGLPNETFTGAVTAINSRLDEVTRNILVQGTLPNPQGKLRPGMFVNVALLLPERQVLAIPASAVSYAPYGDSVFVLQSTTNGPGKIVAQQFVRLGANRGDRVEVLTGLKEGDEIVSSGAFKLRNGVPVQVNNAIQPGNELQPTPPNT